MSGLLQWPRCDAPDFRPVHRPAKNVLHSLMCAVFTNLRTHRLAHPVGLLCPDSIAASLLEQWLVAGDDDVTVKVVIILGCEAVDGRNTRARPGFENRSAHGFLSTRLSKWMHALLWF